MPPSRSLPKLEEHRENDFGKTFGSQEREEVYNGAGPVVTVTRSPSGHLGSG
jgi:hypothetical protein